MITDGQLQTDILEVIGKDGHRKAWQVEFVKNEFLLFFTNGYAKIFFKTHLLSFISLDQKDLISNCLFLAGSGLRTLRRGKRYDEFIGM